MNEGIEKVDGKSQIVSLSKDPLIFEDLSLDASSTRIQLLLLRRINE